MEDGGIVNCGVGEFVLSADGVIEVDWIGVLLGCVVAGGSEGSSDGTIEDGENEGMALGFMVGESAGATDGKIEDGRVVGRALG
jgi:hypothetical protein